MGLIKDSKCATCGMPVSLGEFHPHLACVMFKADIAPVVITEQVDRLRHEWFRLGAEHNAEMLKSARRDVQQALVKLNSISGE